jgi:hypothetical protein
MGVMVVRSGRLICQLGFSFPPKGRRDVPFFSQHALNTRLTLFRFNSRVTSSLNPPEGVTSFENGSASAKAGSTAA